jgi:hypothetical protein
VTVAVGHLFAQEGAASHRLGGFDASMQQVARDWSVPGIWAAVVVRDKLVGGDLVKLAETGLLSVKFSGAPESSFPRQ